MRLYTYTDNKLLNSRRPRDPERHGLKIYAILKREMKHAPSALQ